MALTRCVARRHRRWRQKENKKRKLEKLRHIEEEILGSSPQRIVEWEARGPDLEGSELLGIDQSAGPDATVVITGTKGKDGTYTIKPTVPGRYLITARVS
jgi:hypothetical protein